MITTKNKDIKKKTKIRKLNHAKNKTYNNKVLYIYAHPRSYSLGNT